MTDKDKSEFKTPHRSVRSVQSLQSVFHFLQLTFASSLSRLEAQQLLPFDAPFHQTLESKSGRLQLDCCPEATSPGLLHSTITGQARGGVAQVVRATVS